MENNLQILLTDAVQGDLAAFERVKHYPSPAILEAFEALHDLTFKADSVVCVIEAHMAEQYPEDLIQAWGDFARFGYLKTDAGELIRTPFERDSDRENEILEAVARLGELGDIVDGVMTMDECEHLLRMLAP